MTIGIDKMPALWRRISLTIAGVVAPAVMIVLTWSLVTGSRNSYGRGEIRSVTLPWPVWPFRLAFAVAFALFVLVLFRTLWRHLRRVEDCASSDDPGETGH
jgi:TRAP-type C4-dicarboxylate transport system permease small subunit